ncbi:MAG: sulfite exporter TauE/SafE family protein [Spirochaetaceae bacterium]|nr:MAG: sulfite exporter TauE/SafE family protein [Spirochaetaceae bacterium]
MDMTLAVVFGLLVGLSLGLTGGGGSILAVPLLIYGLGMELRAAVAISLAVVGLTSLFGAVIQARSGNVLWKAGAILGLGGIIAAPFGAQLGTRIPEDISLVLFAALMIFVGARMARRERPAPEVPTGRFTCPLDEQGRPAGGITCALKLGAAGLMTGVLSGFFGVGGGFLLAPALIFVAGVSIDRALATSLVAIALTAVSGFIANFAAAYGSPVALTAVFAAGSWAGMVGGAWLKQYLSPVVLRRIFAVVAVGAGLFVAAETLIFV